MGFFNWLMKLFGFSNDKQKKVVANPTKSNDLSKHIPANEIPVNEIPVNEISYSVKSYYSQAESKLLYKLQKVVNGKYLVYPQVNLVAVLNKESSQKYRNELFRNVDYGIFDTKTLKPVLLIELNDKTHKQAERHQRDLKVRDILKNANLPLLTLYTSYDNAEEYIYKRLLEYIKL